MAAEGALATLAPDSAHWQARSKAVRYTFRVYQKAAKRRERLSAAGLGGGAVEREQGIATPVSPVRRDGL